MSRDNRFKAKDKKTHKMTKDGLVEVNQTTGEEARLSQRGQEFQLRLSTPEQINTSDNRSAPGRSGHGGRHTQPNQRTADAPADYTRHEDGSYRSENTQPTSHENAPADIQPQQPTMRSSHDSTFTDSKQDNRQRGTQYQQQFQTEQASQRGSQPAEHPADTASTSFNSDAGSPPPLQEFPHDAPRSKAPTDASFDLRHSESEAVPMDSVPAPSGKGRLQYDKPDASTASGSKPNQSGTKYAQKFSEPDTATTAADKAVPEAAVPRSHERSDRLHFDKPDTASSAGAKPDQRSTKYTQKFAAEKSADGVKSDSSGAASATKSKKEPKLQFAGDEVPPDKKLEKSRMKAERTSEKLKNAKERLPIQRRVRVKKDTDPDTGKTKRKLTFDKEVKSQRAHLKGPIVTRPVKTGANMAIGYAHKKIYQVEQENVGTEAAHKGELMVEGVARRAYRLHKTAPYRKVAKLERLNRKHSIKLSYRQALHDNPQLKKKAFSRFIQKQKIKRQYAKAAREAKRGAKNAKKVGDYAGKAVKAIAGAIRRHPVAAGIVLLILLLIFIIVTMLGSFTNLGTSMLSSVVASSYVAEDRDIDDAELAYTEWEADLLLEVQNAESTHSGYDEYRYNVGDVSHDPYELMAYLTAKYQDFTFAEIQAELRAIFAEQYQLSFVEEVETRYRTETFTDPDTGEEYEEEVPYDWYVLNVNLTARSFSDIVQPRMDSDQRELFDILMQTKGNRQYALNPFDFNWLPYVSDNYGWRIHPITGEKDNHRGIDIAVSAGTEILTTHDGRITFAGSSGGYGLVVIIEDDKGLTTKYAHCSELLVSAGQEVAKGDPIAKVGSTGDSTGAHLHFEVLQNGQYLNPLFFSETGDDGSGRIPPGQPGGVEYPEYPGEPLGDGSYAALIAEAEKHLGKKYVFGASGPANFDCSGFVSWVLDKSGVKPMSRTNAQGIYNMCTPVSASEAQPGDLIFFQGTYSTPNAVSHIGIYVGNGMMLHCGNPIQYTSINSRYWQDHFYSFARIN